MSAVWGWIAYFRRGTAGTPLAHLLTLCQTLLVAQVGLGLLLLSSDHRAPEQLHYAYGTFALLAVLSPWFYAPKEPRRRLALVLGRDARGRRARGARLHDGLMFSRMNPTLRGFLIIALIALVVVVLNLYVALASLFLIAQIAFFLAIAFFIYLLWRERREDIADVADAREVRVLRRRAADRGRDRRLLPRPPGGPRRARVPARSLGISGFAMWRAWRDQHTYS